MQGLPGGSARGSQNGGTGPTPPPRFGSGAPRAAGGGRKPALCSNCSQPLSQDELLLSTQTEGRCIACQQLVEAQSACRICHLPWDDAEQHDLVPCAGCGYYMHAKCVEQGALTTKSGGRIRNYCPHCPPPIELPEPVAPREQPSARAAERGGGRQRESSGALSLSLAAAGAAASAAGGGGLGASASGRAGSGSLSSAAALGAAAGALATPANIGPPQSVQQAQLQQVAAMLQGQLRMLQTQQVALYRQYEQQLRGVLPSSPPNAYALFQVDMFRVYQEEGFEIDPQQLAPIISNAWYQLTAEERAGYDNRAQQELAAWNANAQLYAQLYTEYETLAAQVGAQPDAGMMPKALQGMMVSARQQQAALRPLAAAAAAQVGLLASGRAGGGGGRPPSGSALGGRGLKRPAAAGGIDALAGAAGLLGIGAMSRTGGAAGGGGGGDGGMGGGGGVGDDDDDDEDYEAEGHASKRSRRAMSPGAGNAPFARPPPRNTRLPADRLPTCIGDLPQQLKVSCNDVAGTFIMDGIKVVCMCKDCVDLPRAQREFHPTHWEQHCGAGTAKKWKASIKIEPGGAPEVPFNGNAMQIGKWFDMLGVEFRPAKTTGGPPVLEFTGATIRRLEAEGGVFMQAAVIQQQPPPPQITIVPAPRLSRPPAATPPLGRSSGVLGGGGGGGGSYGSGGGGSSSRRFDDGAVGSSKPQRPVSYGDGDAEGEVCLAPLTAADGITPRGGGAPNAVRGDDVESSSRGSASDTLGPNATA